MTIAPPSQDGLDRFTLLKFNLLARGARIAAATAEALWRQAKPALRVRSGSCGGLDLVLPDGSHVNCPVAEPFAEASDLEISLVDGQFVIDWAGDHVVVKPVPVPAYYSANDSLGHPLVRSGQICFDRLG